MKRQRPISVLQVIDSLGMGGAETWLMEVLRLWSKSGDVQMDFLMTSGNRAIFDEEALRLGARIHYVRYGRRYLLRFAKKFHDILREGQYDAIHDHQDYASGWHFLIGGKALPPVRVTHIHNPSYQIRNNYGVTLARRLTARIGRSLIQRYSTHITGTSRQVITEYGFDTPRFHHMPKSALYCGFDPSRFLGDRQIAKTALCREFTWPENSKILLFAGRLDKSPDMGHPQNHKNSGFAVSVGIECVRHDPSVRMIFAGKISPSISILEARIAEAGFAEYIRFAGIRIDIARLMLASDSLLFPSRGEGLGMVAVEAQAAGLPVLASTAVPRECVVVPELVRFKELEAGAASWAEILCHLAASPRNISFANQRVATSAFAIENSSHALLKLYKEGSFV